MDNKQNVLDNYLNELDNVANDRKSKSIKLVLPKGQKYYEYFVITDLYLGSLHNVPKLKKLIEQLKIISERPNCYIVLGGNLFSHEKNSIDIEKQLLIAKKILAPYKKQIILAYDGPEENKFKNRKVHNEPLEEFCNSLGITSKYRPYGARINVVMNNEWTKNSPKFCNDCFVSMKSNAILFSSTANAAIKTIGSPANFDNGFVTCSNNSFRAREAVMRATKNVDQIAKHNYNLISISGSKTYQRLPGNKLATYNYTDNYIYHVCIGENKDSTRIVGKNTIIEESLKVFLSTLSVEKEVFSNKEKSITEELIQTKKHNDLIANYLVELIKDTQNEINKTNQNTLSRLKKDIIKSKTGCEINDGKEC